MPLNSQQVADAVSDFFQQLQDGIVSKIEKQALPLIGSLDKLPGISDVMAFYSALETKILDAVKAVQDTTSPTAIAKAINELAIDGVKATVTAEGGIDLGLVQDKLAATGSSPADFGASVGSFLKLDAQAGASIDAKLDAKIGIGPDGSVAIADQASPEFTVQVDGDLSFGAEADLRVVHVTVKDADPAVHELTGTFGLDFKTGADGAIGVTPSYAADAKLDLNFMSKAGEAAPFQLLPDLAGELQIGLHTKDDGTLASPSIAVKDVTVDLGSYLRLIARVAGEVGDVFNAAPLGTLVDVATNPVPVIDSIAHKLPFLLDELDTVGGLKGGGDGKVTLADLAVYADSSLKDTIEPWYKVVAIIDILRGLGKLDGDVKIHIGSGMVAGDGTPTYDQPTDFLTTLKTALAGLGLDQDVVGYLTDFDSSAMNKQLAKMAADESKGFSFGLLEHPEQVLDILLDDKPVSLAEFDVPPLQFEQAYSKFFPIVGPLGVEISGLVGAKIDFDVGYDTDGLLTGNAFDGFYLSTAKDDPTTLPNLGDQKFEPVGTLYTTLGGAAGIGFGGGSLTVGADFNFALYAFLYHDMEGRYRPTADGLDCIFDPIGGSASVEVAAKLKIGFGPFSYTKKFPFANETLGQFETFVCPHPTFTAKPDEPGVATLLSATDTLRLNVGPDTKDRLVPDEGDPAHPLKPVQMQDDSNTPNDESQDESYLVALARDTHDSGISGDGGTTTVVPGFDVHAFGFTQRVGPASLITANFDSGNDSLIIQADVTTGSNVHGGAGEDNLFGGAGSDTFYGDDDNDILTGNGGNDFLYGGKGDDLLSGGKGADVLDGGEGNDTVDYSGANADSKVGIYVVVSPGGIVTGSGGDADGDKLSNIENVIGTDYDDDIRASNADFKVYFEGGNGSDLLVGGKNDDLLLGGEGADDLIGGTGEDATTYIASWGAVDVDLTRPLQKGGEAEGDRLIGIEDIQGSTFDDHLVGSLVANRLDAGDGNDIIEGGGGKDIVTAGAGDDFVYALGDGDTLDGDVGKDTLSYEKAVSAITVDLGRTQNNDGSFVADAAPDSIVMAVRLSTDGGRGYSSFENLIGSGFDDHLRGDNGNNRIEGGAGNDVIAGDAGNDVLIGGEGADQINGGTGIDWVEYRDSKTAVTVDLTAGGIGGTAQGDTYSSVENILGSDYGDTLLGSSSANIIDPAISGRAVTETVDGREGIDTLRLDYSTVEADVGGGVVGGFTSGGSQHSFVHADASGTGVLDTVNFTNIERLDIVGTRFDDQIFGGAGDDRILGGGGNDTIFAGTGTDNIAGGDGDDQVAYGINPFQDAGQPESNPNFLLDGGNGIDTLSIVLAGVTQDVTISGGGDGTTEYKGLNLALLSGGAAANFEKLGTVITGSGDDLITQDGRVDNVFQSGDGNDTIQSGLGRDTVDGGLNTTGLSNNYTFNEDGLRVYEIKDAIAFQKATGDTLVLDYSSLGADQRVVSSDYTVDAFDVTYTRPDTGAQVSSTVLTNAGRFVAVDTTIYGDVGVPRPLPANASDDVSFTGIERLDVTGSAQNDIIEGTETAFDTHFFAQFNPPGTAAPIPLASPMGDDILRGAGGDDLLFGKSGDDLLDGGAGNDILQGSDFSGGGRTVGSAPPEVDTLTGGSGGDTFVLGTQDGALYRTGYSDADTNHAVITDFAAAEGDVIQLYGSADLYTLVETDTGTEICIAQRGGRLDLIGEVQGVKGLDLASTAFRYVNEQSDNTVVTLAPRAIATTDVTATIAAVLKAAPPELLAAKASPALQPADTFAIKQESSSAAFKAALDGTSGASATSVTLSGSAEAFGTFKGDPFGLGQGIIFSTGRVTDLPGPNTVESGGTNTTSVKTGFTFIGRTGNTDIYRADLTHLGVNLNSIKITDSGLGTGGSGGVASGFDLGAVALSHQRIDNATDIDLDDPANLAKLNVFDFSNASITYNPGTQHLPSNGFQYGPDLLGSTNGLVNGFEAGLGSFGYFIDLLHPQEQGSLTLGDGGSIGFDLTQTVSTKEPLYLYVAESGGKGETAIPDIQVSADGVAPTGDLSSDLGAAGLAGDDTTLTYHFTPKAGDTAFSFDAVLFSEELPEFDGTKLSDLFSIKLNGVEIGSLSNGAALSLKSLVYSGSGDLVLNHVGTGPLADQIKADAYTKTLTISGDVIAGQDNVLTIEVKDGRDAFLDSGILIKDSSFKTFARPTLTLHEPGGGNTAAPGDTLTFTLDLPAASTPGSTVTVTATPTGNLDLGNGPGKGVTLTFDPEGSHSHSFGATVVTGADPGMDGKISYTVTSDDPALNGQEIAPTLVDVVAPVTPADPFLLFERLSGDVVPGFTIGNDMIDVTGRGGATTLHIDGQITGKDMIAGFAKDDILVVDDKIFDSNNDGIITFGKNGTLDLDGPDAGVDTIAFRHNSPKSIRYIGTDNQGHFAYADAATRLKGFKEGTLGDDLLSGDKGDKKAEKFFFDTNLDVNWGTDILRNFGGKDRLVTTSKLFDPDNDGKVLLGANGALALTGNGFFDAGHLNDQSAAHSFGEVLLSGTDGAGIGALALQSSLVQNGVTYYVYAIAP